MDKQTQNLDSSTDTKWPKSWSSMEDPVVPLERSLYGHPVAGLLWERQFEKILLKHGREKIPNWECLFGHREKGLFLSVYVDDIKLAGKNKILIRCGNYSTKKSIWENQHLGCTNDNAKQVKILWIGKQDDSATLQSINSMHWWPSFQRGRIEICWKKAQVCSQIFILGTYWTTWYSMVSEQTCTIHHKMDQGLWQTHESIDFIYSSYIWIQTILSCG